MDFFDPVKLSIEENQFIIKHAGEPWVTAGKDIHPVPLVNPHRKDSFPFHYPDGVVPAAVKPVIDRIYELIELERHAKESWIGLDVVKSAAQMYITQCHLWSENKRRRGAVRFPSMHTFTSKGRPQWSAPGSDSGIVKTYFDKSGERIPFAVKLIPEEASDWTPEWLQKVAETDHPAKVDGLKVDETLSRIECLTCGHTESYKEDSRSSFNAARARMSKHLRKGDVPDPDRHREVHALEFGGSGSI